MNLLAIDTSTETASIALMVNGQILSEEQPSQRHHAQYILPMIENLLNKSAVTIKQLDGLVFGRGPGSFTGLRIACSVIKGLAYAHDLPVYPVSSLAAIAQGVYSAGLNDMPVLAAIDARMNQIYWAYFNNLIHNPKEQVNSVADIEIGGDKPLILAGWGYQNYKDQLPLSLSPRIKQEVTLYPKASEMIHLVKSGVISAVTAAEASPIYVRNQITQGEPRG